MTAIFIKGNGECESMSVVKGEIRAEVLKDYAAIYLSESDLHEIAEKKQRILRRLSEIPTAEGRRAYIDSQIRLQTFSLETHRRKELVALELLDFLVDLREREREKVGSEEK